MCIGGSGLGVETIPFCGSLYPYKGVPRGWGVGGSGPAGFERGTQTPPLNAHVISGQSWIERTTLLSGRYVTDQK